MRTCVPAVRIVVSPRSSDRIHLGRTYPPGGASINCLNVQTCLTRAARSIGLILISLSGAGLGFGEQQPTIAEPSYKGKPLSYWILGDSNSPTYYATVAAAGDLSTTEQRAVKAVGTNAIPFLLKWINSSRAVAAFGILGHAASPAIPNLMYLATNQPATNSWTSVRATEALGKIGMDALPALCIVATNNLSKQTRVESLNQIADIGTNAAPAAVALTTCLRDPDKEIVGAALQSLARVRPGGRKVFDVLVTLADNPDPHLEMALLDALGPFSDWGLPIMERAVENDDKYVRLHALAALATAGPDALPSIVHGLTDRDADVRSVALEALVRNDPEELTNRTVLEIGAEGLHLATDRKKSFALLLKVAGEESRGVKPDLLVRSVEDWERVFREATNTLRSLAPELVRTSP